jgi:integrase
MSQEESFSFKLAQIYPPNLDISKSWYIKFKVWHHGQGELVTRRVMGNINRIHNKQERLSAAKSVRDEVNALLKEGWTIGQKETVKTLFKHLSIHDALEAAFDIKKASIREGTWKDYVAMLKNFKKHLKQRGLVKDKIGKLTTPMIEDFLDELIKTRANKTRNNNLTNIRALLRLINRREKIWTEIPGLEIPMLATVTNKHTVFSKTQLQKNGKACEELGEEYLWLFCRFIYYTLARPGELRMLKVEHLDLDDDRIYIPGENAKGRSGEWIDIYPPLRDLIIEHNIHKAPKGHYVFSSGQRPGADPVGKNYFYKRHLKLLEKVGLNSSDLDYTMYSYKHSGCCHRYLEKLDLLDIMRQCRHKSPEQTMKYLRDLGAYRKKDHFSKVEAI